jgi:hypothetical protein
MPRPHTPRITAAVLFALVATTLAGCAPSSPVTEATATAAPTTVAPSTPVVAPSETESAAPADEATCTGILPEDTVVEFEANGLTFREEPFLIGDMEVADGLWCSWADFTLAGDHLQLFGWAPIAPDEAEAAQEQLLAAGWIRETEGDDVVITENPDTTINTDADGYGMTYLFGNGWVIVADTKQGLLLIDRPIA